MRYVSSILGLPTCAGFVLVSSILGLTLSTPQLTSVLTSSTSGCPRTGLSGVAAAVGVVYYCTIKSTSRQWNWIKSEMLRRKSVSGPEPDSKPKQTTSSWKTRPHFQLAVMSWAAGRDQFVKMFKVHHKKCQWPDYFLKCNYTLQSSRGLTLLYVWKACVCFSYRFSKEQESWHRGVYTQITCQTCRPNAHAVTEGHIHHAVTQSAASSRFISACGHARLVTLTATAETDPEGKTGEG